MADGGVRTGGAGGEERVVLVTRAGCHLCEAAREVVAAVCDGAGERWRELDVDADEADRERWGDMVPVVLVDGAQHAFYRVDAVRLREALAGPRGLRHRWGARRR